MGPPRRCSRSPDLSFPIEIVPETGSTNADLLARLGNGEAIAEGYWLVADCQNAGRGRHGRNWLDAPGNFMGSTVVALMPGGPPATTLPFCAALAVYETVRAHVRHGAALHLKWPNDIMLDGAKLAGILIERTGDAAVVGIGVNLAAVPDSLDRAAGHLRGQGAKVERDVFAQTLAAGFGRELDCWRQHGTDTLFARWLASAHPEGAVLTVHAEDGAPLHGVFAGLEGDGALRLRLADGSVRVIRAGDVSLGEA